MTEAVKTRRRRSRLEKVRSDAGSQARLHPQYKDHVWNCAFVEAQTPDGEPFEVLAVLDGYTLECLSISVERQISPENIIDRLFDPLVLREAPKYLVLGQRIRIGVKGRRRMAEPSSGGNRSGRTGQRLGGGRCVGVGDQAEG